MVDGVKIDVFFEVDLPCVAGPNNDGFVALARERVVRVVGFSR